MKQKPAPALKVVVGIDVGGERKGFHAVALVEGRYLAHRAEKDLAALVDWCCSFVRASVIAVDCPCRWSRIGNSRPAERELMRENIHCFFTPTQQKALAHPKDYYGWMRRGAELYRELEKTHALCTQLPAAKGAHMCFETFPHAIVCSILGEPVSARNKRKDRLRILDNAQIDATALKNIDLIDAALCALTAHQLAIGASCVAYGEPDTGLIIVPTHLPVQARGAERT